MATIATGSNLHTLVVVFTVEPENQGALVKRLEDVVVAHAKFDGFVSNSILCSDDGIRVLEYIQWESKAHLMAMRATPGAMDHVKLPGIVSEAHSYVVSSVTER